MENNIKIEPLTTEQKETLVSGLFSMMSNENTQFISKEKYDELEQENIKLKDKVEQLQDRIDSAVELLLDRYVKGLLNDDDVNNIVKILKGGNNEK